MRVYHERLRVPLSWWLLGAVSLLILAGELAAGGNWLTVTFLCLALGIPLAGLLFAWGHTPVEVTGGQLRVSRTRLPLTATGHVTALDQAQTRAMRGPRADPAAFVRSRPYLREAVYVEVTDVAVGSPYWLLGTRHPQELAAAIERSRPGARAGGAAVG